MASSQDLRIAVLHAADQYHAAAFCTIFNGGPRQHEFEDRELPPIPPGARVTAVWDENAAAAETLAKTHHVDHVLSDLQELPKFADAAVLTSGWDAYHHKLARRPDRSRRSLFRGQAPGANARPGYGNRESRQRTRSPDVLGVGGEVRTRASGDLARDPRRRAASNTWWRPVPWAQSCSTASTRLSWRL